MKNVSILSLSNIILLMMAIQIFDDGLFLLFMFFPDCHSLFKGKYICSAVRGKKIYFCYFLWK